MSSESRCLDSLYLFSCPQTPLHPLNLGFPDVFHLFEAQKPYSHSKSSCRTMMLMKASVSMLFRNLTLSMTLDKVSLMFQEFCLITTLQYSNNLVRLNNLSTPSTSEFFFSSKGMIRNEEDRQKKRQGFQKYAFNVLISDRIGPHRSIPDTRFPLCKNRTYSQLNFLPKSSIIICFYNEAASVLKRTIFSILERSQKELIKEIILIDDHSDDGKILCSLKFSLIFSQIFQLSGYFSLDSDESFTEFQTLIKIRRTPERAG